MKTREEEVAETLMGAVEFVSYSGSYPNLCSGTLLIKARGKTWTFKTHSLSSGGSVSFDDNWRENVTQGSWSVTDYPVGFPEILKDAVVEVVNDNVSYGCCGGCV